MTEYNACNVEACDGGWIVRESGMPTKVFVRWESLVTYLKGRLSS